ncbi:hypothetical protein EAF04_005549 [Stromatinia cepivora]|nr:hypothetical protein EAF04_005549 [Stromatinia cepivora]
MWELVRELERQVERDTSLPDDLHFEFFVRRTQIEGEEALIGGVLDGGETVYAKVFNGAGFEFKNHAGQWKAARETRKRSGVCGRVKINSLILIVRNTPVYK